MEAIEADTIERCAQAVWDAGGDNVEFHVTGLAVAGTAISASQAGYTTQTQPFTRRAARTKFTPLGIAQLPRQSRSRTPMPRTPN